MRYTRITAIALGLGMLLAAAGGGLAATITLQAGAGGQPADIVEEAMLVQENANDNFGGRGNAEIGVLGNGRVRTTVMRFDVTAPILGLYIGAVPQFSSIDSIQLKLTTDGNSHNSNNMDLRIAAGKDAQGDWVEGTGTNSASGGDAGTVTYSERREGQGTGWQPDTNYTRNTGDGVLATVPTWPGTNTSFTVNLSPVGGETLTDLVNRWATGNNEGVLLNDVNRSGFARWFVQSSEAGTVANRPELTITYTPSPSPPGSGKVLADSVADWQAHNPQPHGPWTYGRYTTPGNPASFAQNTDPGTYYPGLGSSWIGGNGDVWAAPGYPDIGEYSQSPSNGEWAVRRWTSDTDGPVTVFYDALRLQTGGAGQAVGIYQNGAQVWSQSLTNGTGLLMGSIPLSVQQGDTVDFIVDYAPGDNNSDWTHFTARIEEGPPHTNPGLAAHWAMNETSVMPIGHPNNSATNRRALVGDSSGNNNHMATHNTWSNERVPGLIGNALEFHNGTGYGISNASNIGNGATELTISAWIRPDGKDNWDGILTSKAGGFTGIALADYNGQGYYAPTFRVMNAANVTSAIDTPVGEWSHVVAVWKAGELHRIYINGELGANNDAQAYGGAISMDGDDFWYLGSDRLIGNRWFDGLIDDAGIWTRALSEYEIRQLYLGGLQGIDLAHADIVDVPEPATMLLLTAAIGGLGAYARRRRRA